MTINVTIAEFPSTSGTAPLYTGEATSVAAILESVGIQADGRVTKFNSAEVSLTSVITQDGMLTVTRSAKGNS